MVEPLAVFAKQNNGRPWRMMAAGVQICTTEGLSVPPSPTACSGFMEEAEGFR